MVYIKDPDDFQKVDVVGLQPDDRLPNDYLRMVARILAAYREAPLEKAVVAYLDGFHIIPYENIDEDTYEFTISGGSCFIDDQFIGFLDKMFISVPRSDFARGYSYSIVVHYEWINITPPPRPTIKFIKYVDENSIHPEQMLEIGRFDISATGEFTFRPQDLNGLYLNNFVKLFNNIEEAVLEKMDIFKFQHMLIPEESISPEVKSGDIVYFDFMSSMYRPARACTKRFDKAVGLYLKNKESGKHYLILSGIIQIDPDKYEIDPERNLLLNLERGTTYYLEDGCTETDEYYEFEKYPTRNDFPIKQGHDKIYYVDSETEDIYFWDFSLQNDYDPSLNIVGDYALKVPKPILTATQGKITTRFFPSTVRVGFAVSHDTLFLNLDYSSELNVMNILELIGNSTEFKEHYLAFKEYFEYQNSIFNFGIWLEHQTKAGGTIENLQKEITLYTDPDTGKIKNNQDTETDKKEDYDNYKSTTPDTFALDDTSLKKGISDSLVTFSRTRIDENAWNIFYRQIELFSKEVYDLFVAAQTIRNDFETATDELDNDDNSQAILKEECLNLSRNLNNIIANTIDLVCDDDGKAFKDLFLYDAYGGDDSGIQSAMNEKSASSLNHVIDVIKDWLDDMNPYFDYNRFEISSEIENTFGYDASLVTSKILYLHYPRIQHLLPYSSGDDGINDTLYKKFMILIEKLVDGYNRAVYKMNCIYNYLNNVVTPWLIVAKINTYSKTTGDDTRDTALMYLQSLDTYFNERQNYVDTSLMKFNLWKNAQLELDNVIQESNRLIQRLELISKTVEITQNDIDSWENSKLALESTGGVYARLENQKPVSSIFSLSNFERIQYNYTYLNIRLKTKYKTLEQVQINIELIRAAKDNLVNGSVIYDQNKLDELNRLQVSYETIENQLKIEISSMVAEYNRIRTEYYGLTPIAVDDPDFDINDEEGAQYANPDLECMAISE